MGWSEYKIATQSFKIIRWIANSHKFISIFITFQYIHTDFIWKGIFRIVITNSQICQAFLLFSIWFKYYIWTNILKYWQWICEKSLSVLKDMHWLHIHHSLLCLWLIPTEMVLFTNCSKNMTACFIATHCNCGKCQKLIDALFICFICSNNPIMLFLLFARAPDHWKVEKQPKQFLFC